MAIFERVLRGLGQALFLVGLVAYGNAGASPGRIDYTPYALLQIEQKQTGTCLYNSVTSLLEIGYRAVTGYGLEISNAAVLAEIPNEGPAGEKELHLLEAANRLPGVVAHKAMPYRRYFKSNLNF